jgi:hypothetical protein
VCHPQLLALSANQLRWHWPVPSWKSTAPDSLLHFTPLHFTSAFHNFPLAYGRIVCFWRVWRQGNNFASHFTYQNGRAKPIGLIVAACRKKWRDASRAARYCIRGFAHTIFFARIFFHTHTHTLSLSLSWKGTKSRSQFPGLCCPKTSGLVVLQHARRRGREGIRYTDTQRGQLTGSNFNSSVVVLHAKSPTRLPRRAIS